MNTAQLEEVMYRGYRMTVSAREIVVHSPHGRTKARFKSMAAARAFVRWLHRSES
jgi:hypothetical protein